MTPNPTYEEVCSARTGHNEVVLVVYRPAEVSYEELLATFWEAHDPTQGMRQGNDVGTQYRSGIYTTTDEQAAAAAASRERYQEALTAAGRGEITTEIVPAPEFYYAEDYHQQYLAKNPARLLRARRDGRHLPDRRRRRVLASAPAANRRPSVRPRSARGGRLCAASSSPSGRERAPHGALVDAALAQPGGDRAAAQHDRHQRAGGCGGVAAVEPCDGGRERLVAVWQAASAAR